MQSGWLGRVWSYPALHLHHHLRSQDSETFTLLEHNKTHYSLAKTSNTSEMRYYLYLSLLTPLKIQSCSQRITNLGSRLRRNESLGRGIQFGWGISRLFLHQQAHLHIEAWGCWLGSVHFCLPASQHYRHPCHSSRQGIALQWWPALLPVWHTGLVLHRS